MNLKATLFAGSASLALSACAVIGTPVESMDAPLIFTANFREVTPAPKRLVDDPRPPRTFFFSGETEPTSNYFLANKLKAMIPDAARTIANPEIRDYLHGVATKLMAHAPANAPEVQVHALASPTYNAFARANGDIYVSINVLAQAGSEDEVAVLLGHEIAHVLLNHHEKDSMFNKQRDLTSAAVVGAAFTSYVALLGKSGQLKELNFDLSPAQTQELTQGALAMSAIKMGVDFVGNDIINSSWNRAQENEADLLGLDLAIRAGYDPYAAFSGFDALSEGFAKRRTHLSKLEGKLSERAEAVKASFEAGNLNTDLVAQAFVGGTLDAVSAAGRDAWAFVARSYADPAKRADRADVYLGQFYPDIAVDPTEEAFAKMKERLKIVEINNAYALVEDARVQIEESNHREALDLLQQAYQTGPIERDPYPREVEAIAREGLNDLAGAVTALNSISPSAHLSAAGYRRLADIEVRRNRPGQAIAALDQAEQLYGADSTYPKRVFILATLERTEQANEILEQCGSLAVPTHRACKSEAVKAGLLTPEETQEGLAALFATKDASETPATEAPETHEGQGLKGLVDALF
ncbi:MAG: M48 family metalloprotease [Geminicoccaceae bacterium]